MPRSTAGVGRARGRNKYFEHWRGKPCVVATSFPKHQIKCVISLSLTFLIASIIVTVSSYSFVTTTPSWMCCRGFRLALISPSIFGACKELSVGVRALSTKLADEVEIDAGQRSADLVHSTAYCQ